MCPKQVCELFCGAAVQTGTISALTFLWSVDQKSFFADWLKKEFSCAAAAQRGILHQTFMGCCVSVWTAAYCSINDPPLNGGVINRTKLRPGSKLLYYCNRGYHLVGSSNATCRLYPNGLFQWDTPPPLCQGKNFRLVGIILAFRKQGLQDFSELIPARLEQR